jgi:hypothetical protein
VRPPPCAYPPPRVANWFGFVGRAPRPGRRPGSSAPGSRVLRDGSFSRCGLSAGLGGVLRAGLDGVWDRDASRILVSSAVCEGFVLLYSGCVIWDDSPRDKPLCLLIWLSGCRCRGLGRTRPASKGNGQEDQRPVVSENFILLVLRFSSRKVAAELGY